MSKSILVNVNRCTGCWTCTMSCKVEHKLDTKEFYQYIRTVGSGEIDQPGGTWPNVYMKWFPVWKQTCLHCGGDPSLEGNPICVYNCPTGALTYGDLDDPESAASQRKAELLAKGFRCYQIPEWEDTRDNIYYMEKGI